MTCSLYRLPRDDNERQLWINAIPYYNQKTISADNFRVCRRHWPEDTEIVRVAGGSCRSTAHILIFPWNVEERDGINLLHQLTVSAKIKPIRERCVDCLEVCGAPVVQQTMGLMMLNKLLEKNNEFHSLQSLCIRRPYREVLKSSLFDYFIWSCRYFELWSEDWVNFFIHLHLFILKGEVAVQ